MGELSTPARTGLLAMAVVAVAGALYLAEWLPPDHLMEFVGLLLATVLVSTATGRLAATHPPPPMPPSFVIDFTALLLFGPHVAVLVASTGVITQELAPTAHTPSGQRLVRHMAASVWATCSAGIAYGLCGGAAGVFTWPWQALPVAAAASTYVAARAFATGLLLPRCGRQPVDHLWMQHALHGAPLYVVGASLGVTIAALIQHRMWDALLLATVPLYFACRVYCDHLGRLDGEQQRHEVVATLDEGMAVVGPDGRVVFWNDVLERLVGCRRERALHQPLSVAVPSLAKTELPQAIEHALQTRTGRTLDQVRLPAAGGLRILQVKIVPVSSGVALLWQDVTERTHSAQALARGAERLAVAAECASDGLWEWDLSGEQFHVSGPWKALLGLDPAASIERAEEWIQRLHPDDVEPLKAALEGTLAGTIARLEHVQRIRHEDGSYRRFICRGLAVRGAGRRTTRIAGSLSDTAERAQDRQLSAGARDALTGLCNRAEFVGGLSRGLDTPPQGRASRSFAVLYLDLDRFKVVNDSLGHAVGDELLVGVSRRLESCLRPGDALARLGGDEFAILLRELSEQQQANAIAYRIVEALAAPFVIGSREVFTSVSIGIAFGPGDYVNADDIVRDADMAMDHAKSRGKARHEVFDADMHARVRDRLDLESDLRNAVSSNDFEVHYQPIVSMASGMCVGFESLIRWTRNGEPVSPAIFIPIAEELGLIESVGTWVLQQACLTFAVWLRRFPDSGLDYITVNVSSRQLTQHNFLRIVEKAVGAAGLKPSQVRLEITETALMDSPQQAAAMLRDLREFGVKIYLDDFGTGCSSLSHLHKLPVDTLKIDRSFVTSLLIPDRPAMVESILALARTLNTSVVAEGIETAAQAHELERLGCTHAQGYLFSRPLSTTAAEALIIANQPLGHKHPRGAVAVVSAGHQDACPTGPFQWPDRIVAESAASPPITPRVPTRVA